MNFFKKKAHFGVDKQFFGLIFSFTKSQTRREAGTGWDRTQG